MATWLRFLPFRMRALLGRRRLEQEMEEELRSHLELQEEAAQRRGLDPAEARRQARVEFGNVLALKEECRESWGLAHLDDLVQDVRTGLRGLRRNPGYTAVVVLTLGLGIGANTAIFSVVRGILLRPLPYAEGERIVALSHGVPEAHASNLGFSVAEVDDLRRLAHSLDALAEYHAMTFTLLGGAEPLRVRTAVVSAGFFEMLGVQPRFGRGFQQADDAPGAEAVLLLGDAYWRSAFGGDPGVVGRVFRMNDRPHRVIGVLPPLPAFPGPDDVYMPSQACPFRARAAATGGRQARMLAAIGRLAPGVTASTAQAELTTLMTGLAREHPDAYPTRVVPAIGLDAASELMVRDARPTFLVLLATVGLVLLVACANVANLALSRQLDRGKEFALRAALGAGRGRLLRQLLTESTLLSCAGGAAGLLFAMLTQGALVAFAGQFTPRAAEVRLDGPVLVFTLGLSLLAGILFGTLPGLPRSDSLARAASADDGRLTAGPGRRRLRSVLVVAQVALSFTLVTGAALLLRSFARLQAVDPGFQVENVVTLRLDLNWASFLGPERALDVGRLAALYDTLHERLQAQPGVLAAGTGWTFPLNSQYSNDGTLLVEGREPGSVPPRAERIATSPDYFRALGVPLAQGRFFTRTDTGTSSDAVLVNQALARREWPEGALGRRLSLDGGKTWRTVAGVVGDIRQGGLAEPPRPSVYLPLAQFPGASGILILRANLPPATLASTVRAAVHDLAADTAVGPPLTLEQIRHDSLASSRLTALLLSVFAGLALLIAATGLSGVLAYSVSQRTREIGVRVALGAAPRDVVALVVRQGLGPLGVGLALGLVSALGLTQLISKLLFGIEPTDPACFAGSLALLGAVGVLACLLPARRAVGVEPVRALRAM
jgi:predicted permease